MQVLNKIFLAYLIGPVQFFFNHTQSTSVEFEEFERFILTYNICLEKIRVFMKNTNVGENVTKQSKAIW